MVKPAHIIPFPEKSISRSSKEQLLNQKGLVVWLTGLSAAGKSTLANELEKVLHAKGYYTVLLDGDTVRKGINNNLGFGKADRQENIRRIAELSKVLAENGVIVISAFITPSNSLRQLARSIIGPSQYVEVFVDAPLAVCESRDPKGLYGKARKGLIPLFTGIDAPFEIPENPDVHLHTDRIDVPSAIDAIFTSIYSKIKN